MTMDVDHLVHQGLPIVETVARRLEYKLGGLLGRDELLAIAQPALIEAARAYDPTRAPFAPYLVMRIKWALLDAARKVRRRRRVAARAAASAALERLADDGARMPAGGSLRSEEEYQADLSSLLAQHAAAMVVGLVSVVDSDRHESEQETPEDRLAREELRHEVRCAIAKLPDHRQRALVERHYFGDERFDAIAADLGLSKSWASRLHAQAMDALSLALRGRV